MAARVRALLVHDEERPVAELKPLLESQGIETLQVRSCGEAEAALASVEPPALIFTDTALPDGTWVDVQSLAEERAAPVVVISRFVDLPFYLEVLENGASDYMVPPFQEADVAYVVRSALLDRQASFAPPRTTAGIGSEVTPHAQNHSGSGVQAAHAQAGR